MSFIGSGVAEHDIGGFPLADSASVADPLLGLISDPTRPREFLLRGTPLSGGSPVNVDLSGSGYRSQPADSPYKLFPGGIRRPYNFTASLPLPDMSGGVSLGIGDLEINNGDGLRDTDAQYDWLGQDADVYMGPPEPSALTLFTRIFRGKAAGTVWTLDNVSILHRDLRFKLQKRLQPNRYKGFGACVRYDGSTSYASGTVTCPAGAMAIACHLRRETSIGSVVNVVTWSDGVNVAGLRSIQIGSPANTIRFNVGNDAGTLFTITASAVLPVSQLKGVVAILDLTANVIRLYIGNEEAATPVAVTGTSNTIETSFTIGRFPTGILYFAGDVDEVAVFNAIPSADIQQAYHERQLSGVETALVNLWHCDAGSGTSLVNAVGGAPSLTLTSGTWVGSLEGDSSLAAVPKPVGLGKRRQITPRLVDSQRLVYQVHDGSMQALDAVRDSGDPLTFGADVSDIYASVPAAGTYNTCLAKGLFRLGSSPVGTITCDIRGDNSGSLGYTATAATSHRKLMTVYGGLTDPTDLDVAAYASLAVLNDAVTGHYFDTDTNVDVAGDAAVKAINAWWGGTRVATATVGRIDDPANETATVAWTQDDLDQEAGTPYRREPLGIRVGEVVIGYRPYHTTLSADQVAGAVSLSNREDFGKPYRFVSAVDDDRFDDADTLTLYTDMDEAADAQAEADRLLAFLSRDLGKITLALDSGSLNYYVGTVGSLEITQTRGDGTTFARYDTSGGKKVVVVGIAEDMGEHGSPDRLEVTAVG